MKKTIPIEGRHMTDIPSFYREINRVFMQDEDWKLGESLDAFNDLLYGGFGLIKNNEPVELIWYNIESAEVNLGLECTKEFYRSKIDNPGVYNSKWAAEKLLELETGQGQTYFEILLEIIEDHPVIELIKK